MKRYPDWQARLTEYFNSVADTPFEGGSHDCLLFISSAVEAQTGEDIAGDFRGQYTDRKGALHALRDIGSGTLLKTVNQRLGKSKHVAQVKRGDVVMYEGCLGICCGSFSRFIGSIDESANPIIADGSEAADGLIAIPTRLCARAWSVAF